MNIQKPVFWVVSKIFHRVALFCLKAYVCEVHFSATQVMRNEKNEESKDEGGVRSPERWQLDILCLNSSCSSWHFVIIAEYANYDERIGKTEKIRFSE